MLEGSETAEERPVVGGEEQFKIQNGCVAAFEFKLLSIRKTFILASNSGKRRRRSSAGQAATYEGRRGKMLCHRHRSNDFLCPLQKSFKLCG
jgi:hypothetical protein